MRPHTATPMLATPGPSSTTKSTIGLSSTSPALTGSACWYAVAGTVCEDSADQYRRSCSSSAKKSPAIWPSFGKILAISQRDRKRSKRDIRKFESCRPSQSVRLQRITYEFTKPNSAIEPGIRATWSSECVRALRSDNGAPFASRGAGGLSADVVLNILARRRDPRPPSTILTPAGLTLRHAPVADCARYDNLRRTI